MTDQTPLDREWAALRSGLSKAYTAKDIDAALATARPLIEAEAAQPAPLIGCQCPTTWHGVVPPPCPLHNPQRATVTTTGTGTLPKAADLRGLATDPALAEGHRRVPLDEQAAALSRLDKAAADSERAMPDGWRFSITPYWPKGYEAEAYDITKPYASGRSRHSTGTTGPYRTMAGALEALIRLIDERADKYHRHQCRECGKWLAVLDEAVPTLLAELDTCREEVRAFEPDAAKWRAAQLSGEDSE